VPGIGVVVEPVNVVTTPVPDVPPVVSDVRAALVCTVAVVLVVAVPVLALDDEPGVAVDTGVTPVVARSV
jgi:hypothetical protein